jgi:hypothetical protein
MGYNERVAETIDRVNKEIDDSYATPSQCFLFPTEGRVVVAQDVSKAPSKIIIAPSKYRARPTTGRVIATHPTTVGWLHKRVLYGMMSGVAVQFKHRPAWIVLAEAEILCEIGAEDAEIDQDTPLSLDDRIGG